MGSIAKLPQTQAFARELKIAALAFAIVFHTACGGPLTKPQPHSLIASSTARELADSTANDLLKDRLESLHPKLEKNFRNSVNNEALNSIVGQMIEAYGTPMEFEFKLDEPGSKDYADGTTKPMRKVWYAAKTTKFDKGSHFLIVEVVPDGDGLAVSSFAIVNFPIGIPENLR